MSQATMSSQTTSPESRVENGVTPPIGKNLFWDDVRIGLNMLAVGVGILLAGAVIGPWILPGWLVVLAVLAGSIATVLGLKVCAAIPPESKVSALALGAFVTGKLCFLAVIVGFFSSWQLDGIAIAALALGGLAHVLFAAVLRGVAAFVGHGWLTTVASGYVAVAAIYSVFLAVVCLTPVGATFNGQVAAQGVTILVGALLLYLLSGAYAALQRAQQGLPVEAPTGARAATAEAGAEPAVAHKELSFKPAPPPETFQFSKNDVDGFQAQDSTAGKAIVALMTGVFSVGVILYTIIAIMAAF